MVHALILFVIGFILWKFLPGKITAVRPKVRYYIDLGAQILGVILMLSGVVNFIKSLFL
jgi:hypothetical protein